MITTMKIGLGRKRAGEDNCDIYSSPGESNPCGS